MSVSGDRYGAIRSGVRGRRGPFCKYKYIVGEGRDWPVGEREAQGNLGAASIAIV